MNTEPTNNNEFVKKTMPELHRPTVEELKNLGRNKVVVVLDNVRSRNNVGSIFRTCDAFCVQELRLCGYTPRPPHRDIFKTALGATETVPWKYDEDIKVLLSEFKDKGFAIWAVEQTHNSTGLQDFARATDDRPTVLIFGNEVSGVSDEALSYCDGSFEIPQWGNKHSLNISVSVGVALWEVVRNLKFGH